MNPGNVPLEVIRSATDSLTVVTKQAALLRVCLLMALKVSLGAEAGRGSSSATQGMSAGVFPDMTSFVIPDYL